MAKKYDVPDMCASVDRLCLCSGGAHVLCKKGKDINDGKKEALLAFSSGTATQIDRNVKD